MCEVLAADAVAAFVVMMPFQTEAPMKLDFWLAALLLYGFMCVSFTTAIWDNLAAQLGLPVSMTHTSGKQPRISVVIASLLHMLCRLLRSFELSYIERGCAQDRSTVLLTLASKLHIDNQNFFCLNYSS